MQVTIVSKHFWPSLQEETFTLHPAVDHRIKQFAAAYAQVKQPRKLVGACCSVALLARRPDVLCVWVCGCVGGCVLRRVLWQELVCHRGTVEVELEFDDGATRCFHVPPVAATLILHFQDQGTGRQCDMAGPRSSHTH